ncbi:alpha/beta fold hydrolase [Nocardia pseudobrasiliensis]|uniref:Alpha/beta hydrolase family protein n=1 Tax=Nocardia pseudobrasiliensis TaxID=45979 RepID=A0A370I147_9NOCA|nr:alpha/beta fold hydrolase [Nocardia pseudobrasiliensis]RDI64467.1 alpha/beta hydrolase family protein [Nocardia pseudobrasiliensis]
MAVGRVRRFVVGVVVAAGIGGGMPAVAAADEPWYARQELEWKACGDPVLDGAGAQCAGVVVPLDYARPDGRTLTVAISRIPASDPSRRRGILLSNPGGPGGPGLQMMVNVRKTLSADVQAEYDLIGMDPRGIGRSDRVNCVLPLPTMLFSAGFDLFGYARDTTLAAAFAGSCLASDPEKVRYITTRNTARDMDVIRSVFGESKINYYGASYGTYLGSVYTQLFPEHSDRIVLDSAVDPDRYWLGMFQDMGPANEAGLDDWAIWAARHDAEYHFGDTPAQVRAFVEDVVRRAAGHPIVGSGYLVDEHTVPMMLLALLLNPKLDADLAEVVRMVADGVSGLPLDMERLKSKISSAVPVEASAMAAIMCGDRSAPRDPAWYYANIERARPTQPVFGAFANNITACAFWPDPVEPITEIGNPTPALILQATGDTRTAYAEGLAMHRDLPASRLITLADTRIHGTFRAGLSPCLNDIVNAYLADGIFPATDRTCRPDPSYFPE